MAFDSSLLCAEDYSIVDGFEEEVNNPQTIFNNIASSSSIADEDRFSSLINKEQEFMVTEDYLTRLYRGTPARNDSIDWIFKVHGYYNFQPLTACLSINYLDRFLSEHELPGKAWMAQLLSLSCVSLAAKMEETDVPLEIDLQVGEAKFVFEARTIKRMELLLLSSLKWRTNAVTPFSFIDYFLNRINPENPHHKSLFPQIEELVLATTRVIEFLKFRPSEIAFAIVVSVTGVDFCESVDSCSYINKERTWECYQSIQEISEMKQWWSSIGNVPRNPVGALDANAYLSKDSSKTEVGSSFSDYEHASKRLKLEEQF